MAEEEEFGLDTQAIMWRTGFLFYGYLLLLCLIAAPWVVFACRSRYAVLHLEWTCRGCKQNYTGRRARRRTCRACGKRRHFVNKAPLWIACICAPLCLYGGALLFWGGLMYRFRGRLDTNRLVRVKDISIAKDYALTERTGSDGSKFVTEIPMKLVLEYIELYVELPIRIDPLRFEIMYKNADSDYEARIGTIDVPLVRVNPGDVAVLKPTMELIMDQEGLALIMVDMFTGNLVLHVGPIAFNYAAEPNGIAAWVMGDSDMSVKTSVSCIIHDAVSVENARTNCTDMSQMDARMSEVLAPLPLSMMYFGSALLAVFGAAFEVHLLLFRRATAASRLDAAKSRRLSFLEARKRSPSKESPGTPAPSTPRSRSPSPAASPATPPVDPPPESAGQEAC